EKEKMLSGEPFQPFSTQLVTERETCKSAVYRFNNADNPQKDITRESRDVLFRAILAARWTLAYSEVGKSPPCGHLGREVYVDTPFMCEYGYNLSIGDNVDIGTSCKFLDSGRISIGRNSSVGANVTIDTQRTPTDCKGLKGSRRTAVAAEIHIGENVHISSNCTILAGVRIGAGAIIHPGSVVVRDIPENCIARGNPA
ncbi:trimeric LpxA-like protein, partial [Periconia macrospinosa]